MHNHKKSKKGTWPFKLSAASMFLFFCFILCSLEPINAQPFKSTMQGGSFEKYSETDATVSKKTDYFIVRFIEGKCQELVSIKIIRRIEKNIAIVIQTDEGDNFIWPPCVEKIAPANNLWKLSASIEAISNKLSKEKGQKFFTVTSNSINALLLSFSRKAIDHKTVSISRESNSAVISCSAADFFSSCLSDPNLLFVDVYHQPTTDLFVSGYTRNINKINSADFYLPTANGVGINIGIKEKMMDEADIDIQKRVLPSVLASPEKEYHANVIATLAGGAGNSSNLGKGPASRCNFLPSSFNNLFPDSSNFLLQKNVTVQNHAYGTVIQPFYGAEAVAYDVQTNQFKTLVHIFSSGNKGTESASTGSFANIAGFGNLTGNFKMAKNVITVAAVDTSGNIAVFSSAGPLFDGRLGPQITALGPNGTSEAAAIVSGATAVLQQVYKDSNAQALPGASLIKAILFTTADDIANNGIDYKSGFGLLNIFEAVRCIQKKQYEGGSLQQGETWTKNLTVPVSASNLKITLAWTDTAAAVNTNTTLVNDIDLELVEINSGMVYKPWQLSSFPHADSLNALPVRKRDSLNTAEQISIELPAPGTYQIKVMGRQIQTANKQEFHVAYKWDTLNILRFTNPVQATDVDRKENPVLSIKWKVAVVDTTSTGNLLISYDNGINWQTIGSGIEVHRQTFSWIIPSIASTAQLKMVCTFGSFYSERIVIAPPTKLNIDYRCNDSLRLSWQKHYVATGYRLFALGDTAHLESIMEVTDTFVVLKKAVYQQHVFAVEPLLSGGLQAARSEAIDVRNQGVECFYKTFLAEQLGDGIELTLELSFLEGITNLSFEKLNAAGTVVRTLANRTTANAQFKYMLFDDMPFNGTNYYRVKITFNNSIAYTYVVAVFHNGNKLVILYPNPVARGQKIYYRIKESASVETLQVTDITGRIMLTQPSSISGEINTGKLPSGIYMFTIRNAENSIITTQKFIIQ